MKRIYITLLVCFGCIKSEAFTKTDTLYINRGLLQTVDSNLLSALSYNSTTSFLPNSKIITLRTGDSLILTIINNDTVAHNFSIKGQNNFSLFTAAGGQETDTLHFDSSGIYLFCDANEGDSYLGLSGFILIEDKMRTNFFWNLREHSEEIITAVLNSTPPNWETYEPNYFTINGNSFPATMVDPLARVIGNNGDTLMIHIVNTGRAVHSIHFHGYHLRIDFSSKFPDHKNRIKDTFPVYPMESLVLELIPDKIGEYPVHDHNLVAVSGGGNYPNGMLLTIKID